MRVPLRECREPICTFYERNHRTTHTSYPPPIHIPIATILSPPSYPHPHHREPSDIILSIFCGDPGKTTGVSCFARSHNATTALSDTLDVQSSHAFAQPPRPRDVVKAPNDDMSDVVKAPNDDMSDTAGWSKHQMMTCPYPR